MHARSYSLSPSRPTKPARPRAHTTSRHAAPYATIPPPSPELPTPDVNDDDVEGPPPVPRFPLPSIDRSKLLPGARRRRLSDKDKDVLDGPQGMLRIAVHILRRIGSHVVRRLLVLGMAIVFTATMYIIVHQRGPTSQLRWFLGQQEPVCSFVSTTDAYRRDLERLLDLHMIESGPDAPLPDTATVRGRHRYSGTGHLVLSDDPAAAHPIPELLALGEERWADLLASQSRTLGEAVAEYQRRYGRRPPKGFDVWWEFAMDHQLVLPDEYDRINMDLAPLWALPRAELRKRLQLVEDMPEVFILDVHNGSVGVEIKDEGGLRWAGTSSRARETAELLESLAAYLPDLRATFSIFDQPQIYLSWARRDSLVSLGLQGQHTTHVVEEDDGRVRLSRACAPDSTLRTNPAAYEGRSLIYDSHEAGDLCKNPYLVPLHGLTIEPHEPDSHPRPHTQLLPLFSLAKTSVNSDILITPLEQFSPWLPTDLPWDEKRDPRLAWRGSPTGISMMTRDIPWRQSHRWRLHEFANNRSYDDTEVLVPHLRNGTAGAHLGVQRETISAANRSAWFFDMSLTGQPLQCDEDDGTCSDMANEIEWADFQHPDDQQDNKFLLDIDGNGWSGRFRRLMATNSVVVKTGIFTEWFQPHLVPWFMYIPSKLDFSDLADIMAFFTGSPAEPGLAFDETAQALGHNGKCFVQRMFRYEDLQAYMLRLFLEYARVIADDGVDMDYYHVEEEVDEEGDDVDGVDDAVVTSTDAKTSPRSSSELSHVMDANSLHDDDDSDADDATTIAPAAPSPPPQEESVGTIENTVTPEKRADQKW